MKYVDSAIFSSSKGSRFKYRFRSACKNEHICRRHLYSFNALCTFTTRFRAMSADVKSIFQYLEIENTFKSSKKGSCFTIIM